MDIQAFRQFCTDEKIQLTEHALLRCRERNIKLDEVEQCILNGEIIEEYPDDYPFPSALFLYITSNHPIHILAGLGEDRLWIITAYYPDPEKWNSDYRTRKETER